MFKMTVEDAIKLHDNLITVAGPCENLREFPYNKTDNQNLVDEEGILYDAHIPLGKTLEFMDTQVILGIYGGYDVKDLMGKTLMAV